MERMVLDSTVLDVEVVGTGEPLLLIHAGVTADGLAAPLLRQRELVSSYRLIHYHRRGYAGTSVGSRPPSVAAHAEDAAALLTHLGIGAAHVAGHSSGAVIALQLAYDRPELVHALALLEPPLMQVPSARSDGAEIIGPAMERYRAGDRRGAVDHFLTAVYGDGWQAAVDAAVPGGAEQAMAEADAFFGAEMPALREWAATGDPAVRITQPILSVVGAESRPFARECRELLHRWFDTVEDLDVEGANHLLQLRNPVAVAQGLMRFLGRHPIIGATAPAVSA